MKKYHVAGYFEGEIEATSREEAEMNFNELDIDSMDITAVWEETEFVRNGKEANNEHID